MSQTFPIDDTDSSIVWNGDWEREGSSFEYNHTCSGSKTAGATAVVTFTGTGITVYGSRPQGISTSNFSRSLYMLDGGPIAGTFGPSRPAQSLYQQKFFESPLLPYGTHQLKIVDATTTDTGLWLDVFFVTTGPGSSSTSVSPTQSTIAQPTESVPASPKPHLNTSVIAVSIAVGGCVLLGALFLIVYFARRRRVKQTEAQVTQTAEPFPLQPHQNHILSLDSPYRHSRMHSDTGIGTSFSVQRSYDMSRHANTGESQVDDFSAQPPMYTKG